MMLKMINKYAIQYTDFLFCLCFIVLWCDTSCGIIPKNRFIVQILSQNPTESIW